MKQLLTLLLLLPLFCFSQIATRYQFLPPPVIIDTAGGGGNDIPPDSNYGRPNLLFYADAESEIFSPNNADPFNVYGGYYSTSITQSNTVAAQGSKAYRFVVSKTDGQVANGRRAELSNYDPLGDIGYQYEIWFGANYYIPPDWTPETNNILNYIVMQFHDYPTNGETEFKSAFQLLISKNKWSLDRRWCATESTGDMVEVLGTDVTMNLNNPTVKFGQWTNIVVHLKFRDPLAVDANDGKIEIWIDGLKCHEYNGKLGYHHAQPPFFKTGIYAWMWNNDNLDCCGQFTVVDTRELFMDEIRLSLGANRYNDVVPPAIP